MSSLFLSTKNRDLQSLSHQAATESWLISMRRSAKACSPGLRIPVVEISEKGYTVGSKTRTSSLQLSGHLERKEQQRDPHAFQNVSFPPVEERPQCPEVLPFLNLFQKKKKRVFLMPPEPTQPGSPAVMLSSLRKDRALLVVPCDRIIPPESSLQMSSL